MPVVSFLSAAAAIAIVTIPTVSTLTLLVLMAVFGGLSIPLYSLCIAHANDYLDADQMVAASGGLVLASGVGAILGPVTASLSMLLLGPDGFFWQGRKCTSLSAIAREITGTRWSGPRFFGLNNAPTGAAS